MHLSWRGPRAAAGGFLPQTKGRRPRIGSGGQRDVRLPLARVQVLSALLPTPVETNEERRAVVIILRMIG